MDQLSTRCSSLPGDTRRGAAYPHQFVALAPGLPDKAGGRRRALCIFPKMPAGPTAPLRKCTIAVAEKAGRGLANSSKVAPPLKAAASSFLK